MFLSRRTRKLTGWLVAAALLFAQAIGVAHACVGMAHSPAMAFVESHEEGGCAGMVNRNACLQHCLADDQNTAQVEVAVAVMPAPAALTVLAALDSSIRIPDSVIVLTRSPGPPPSIRFCSFQL